MLNKSIGGSGDAASDISTLGKQLRLLREAQRLSYEDIANATKVRPHLLQAIEEGTIEKIAAPIYARGFVKTYCEYLMADDLWRKYCCSISQTDSANPADGVEPEPSIDINHPTSMFRRSSIIWVYIILVIAVLGAAYLLWNQQRDSESSERGFPLRIQDRGQQTDPSSDDSTNSVVQSADDLPPSDASGTVIQEGVSADSQSQDSSTAVPSPVFIDLSWMGGDISVSSGELAVPSVRRTAAKQELLIEITGRKNRLVVNRDGKNITTRDLTVGDSRTYYVTSNTEVNLSVGNAADITWYGERYEGAGIGGEPLSLIFHPDGSVRSLLGSSVHFASGGQVAR